MIFVDTGAWFAIYEPTDPNHGRATAWYRVNTERLSTTDYVITETLTLLRCGRKRPETALAFGSDAFDNRIALVYHLTDEDIKAAWNVFRTFSDKEWSFTDCTSKIVMEKQGLDRAFEFDRHFRQFGRCTVVP